MKTLKDLLEADIEGKSQRISDDPNAHMQFEHALTQDLQKLYASLNAMRTKLNNKELVNSVESMYNKVNHLPEEHFPTLHFHSGGPSMDQNPVNTLVHEISMAMSTIEWMIEDSKELNKH